MKRLFLLTAIAGVFAFSNVSAQNVKGPTLGVGADFAIPMGNLSDAYKFGVGGSLLFQTPIAKKLNFTASAGYLNLFGKSNVQYLALNNNGFYVDQTDVPNEGIVPVKVGARYFISNNFYAGGEIGAAFFTGEGGGTAFAYSPSIGFELPVGNKNAIDLSAKYEGWSKNGSVGFFGLRVAYNFGL
ncbi:hypothetical protein HDE69_004486 [Pedobacter cryoconitis]|uniref:Outer membrane protein beta-barrel domain-containing protein n=1 Tax=Pedobacter cryoconitis TaxID=188932 RepID=A0A7W8YXF2_9SPHI|nr:hypothetical protein [Pedobacter cryoconitis]MBB5623402.1 hypothetical protein [Pedobacter cryoconitis]MBB5646613.1 hypothetical protein [Pedobacter cryoconitis]